MTWLLRGLFTVYRWTLSPLLHSFGLGNCKYQPTCSEYAEIALYRHGVFKGTALALWRILRCNPFSKGGLDPVPQIKHPR